MVCGDLLRVLQPGGLHQLLQRVQRAAVELGHAGGLVGHHQRLLAQRVLGGHAGGAVAGVAGLCLQATQRHHEAARRVTPIGPQRHHTRHVKSRDHLARAANPHAAAQAHPLEGVVHQQQALLQRRTHVVAELDRGCPRAALGPVHHDEVRGDAGFQHGLDDGKPLPRVANTKLEAGGFAARQGAQPGDEMQHLHGGGKRTVLRR